MQYHAALDTSATTTAICVVKAKDGEIALETSVTTDPEAIWQARRRRRMMLDGVSLVAPETGHFSHDTEVGADTLIEPNVFFGPKVKVAANARIRAFCHIEGAVIGEGCEVGPFARLRPGARLAELDRRLRQRNPQPLRPHPHRHHRRRLPRW